MKVMLQDPIDQLEQMAKRQRLEEDAARKITTANTKFVLGKDYTHAFFGTLACGFVNNSYPRWDIDTAATDGTSLYYNPEYITGLCLDEAKGLLAHEVSHPALKHHERSQGRDTMRWNVACDIPINDMLASSGLTLPHSALFSGTIPGPACPKEWADVIVTLKPGLAAEEIYNLLPHLEGDDPGQPGDIPGHDPGGCGRVITATSPSEQRRITQEWEQRIAQANQVAKHRGNAPAGLGRFVNEILNPKVDWREVLREFVSQHAKTNYSWLPPNRRFVHMGLYLPGMKGEQLGNVVVMVDTSGSICQREMDTFAGEIQGILDAYDCSMTILYHDAIVQEVQEWRSSDGPLVMTPKGGGGTSHIPAFKWLEENDADPCCIVALTDLCSQFPEHPPEQPVLWVSTKDKTGPWGTTVEISP